MRKILITGKSGYVASSLYDKLCDEYEVTTLGRSELDLSNSHAVNTWFTDKYFDVVIHTAITGGHRLFKDTNSVVDTNLKMYYNLLDNSRYYGKFINVGSGAEIYDTQSPYGLSKHIIRNSVLHHDKFYNIRVYNVFNENERDTRFIKSNVNKYINKESMVVYQDKRMDFFYFEDFVQLVKYYIESDALLKEIDCTYTESYYLSDVLKYINSLSEYSVDIEVLNTYSSEPDYVGTFQDVGLSYVGLHAGIKSVYNSLLCKK